jgi:UDPglucose 6-dehydrogenase
MNNTIGIIGGGFVGSATAWAFRPTHEVKVHDKDPKASTHTFEETVDSDFVFICVPTPPKEDWTIDLSIVESVFENLKGYIGSQQFLIKSTVLPGTCRKMSETYGIRVSSNPEFLTERRAKWDFINAAQILIGCDDQEDAKKIQDLYQQRFNSMKYTITDTVTSELIKYTINCFFATKVSFMNEIKLLSNKIGADWDKLVEGFTSDSRIGDSHIDVPGPDGKYGFGGKCFPKDLNALMELFRNNDIDPLVMSAAWERNLKIR